jgi:Acyl-CoA thioesterase C-terminal domain/Acyl-CoA thioesterase N-terminal domain
VADALYTLDGDLAVPAELTRGPWDPAAQHGGAPAALLAHLVENIDGYGMRIVRMTFELLRPVPIAPLRASALIVRPGRRVQLLEAELRHGDEPVVRARALRIRVEDGAVPPVPPEAGPAPPGPEDGESSVPSFGVTRPWFGEDGVEILFVAGALEEPGPAVAWYRLRVPVVAGRPITPLQRAAAAADFGNGASAALDWTRYVFINPDLTLYLAREPVGEWVCLDARTTIEPDGVGLAHSVVRDTRGPVGRALQGLYVAGRGR